MLNVSYLIFLSTSHHVEEKIYTALIDNGQPLQESYLIYNKGKERGTVKDRQAYVSLLMWWFFFEAKK